MDSGAAPAACDGTGGAGCTAPRAPGGRTRGAMLASGRLWSMAEPSSVDRASPGAAAACAGIEGAAGQLWCAAPSWRAAECARCMRRRARADRGGMLSDSTSIGSPSTSGRACGRLPSPDGAAITTLIPPRSPDADAPRALLARPDALRCRHDRRVLKDANTSPPLPLPSELRPLRSRRSSEASAAGPTPAATAAARFQRITAVARWRSGAPSTRCRSCCLGRMAASRCWHTRSSCAHVQPGQRCVSASGLPNACCS